MGWHVVIPYLTHPDTRTGSRRPAGGFKGSQTHLAMGMEQLFLGSLIAIACQTATSFIVGGPCCGSFASVDAYRREPSERRYTRSRLPSISDGVGETKRVGFVTSRQEDSEDEEYHEMAGGAEIQTVNERLLAQIAEQGRGIVIPTEESKKIVRREEDLNGVNPLFAALGACSAWAMSYGSWQATNWFAQAYYANPAPDSDILAVVRLTAFVKQAVVGVFALGTGIFGVTGLGMAVMAGIVAVGVAKGELDPSPEAAVPRRAAVGASRDDIDRIMIEEAEKRLRQAREDIEREIGGRV